MDAFRKPRRGDVYWVNLDPTIGTEVKKTRPAVILSNNAQNEAGQRVLAAPVTSNTSRLYSFEALITASGRSAKAMLDQVRCLDQPRLGQYICTVSKDEMKSLERALRVAFDLT
jgi:mRNA interferase MazF